MATQGPTTATMAGATPAGMTSRLAQMQMRFQQRQQQERDQRKVEMISTTKAATTTVAAHHQNGGSNGGSSSTIRSSTISAYSATTTTSTSTAVAAADLSASLGAGKVRQMFDERRHRVAGIDKSYPLQPIQQQQTPQQQAGRTVANGGSNVSNGNSAKAAAGLNNKTRVPPISANTKARLAAQQQRQQQQQQHQENGNHVETIKAASFDDNENLLDDEKFPDTISFDDDLTLTPTPMARKLPNVGKLNGQQQNVNSLKLKPVPGRTPTTTTTTPSSAAKTTSSSATKPVPKRQPPILSSSSAPAAPTAAAAATAQSSSSPSSANSAKSSASRASTAKSTTTVPSRKPSAASSVVSAASAGSERSAVRDDPVPDGMARCTICSRNFAEDRIEKHRDICQKTKSKKRKVYDATKHRVVGTDAEKYVLQKKKVGAGASKKSISGPSPAAAKAAAAASSKKSDWRRKHEEFIQTIRAAKELKAHLAKGGKLSDLPPPPPSENPDYVQCPHCSRRFNQTAAERHIPKCANMQHNKPKPTAKAKRF